MYLSTKDTYRGINDKIHVVYTYIYFVVTHDKISKTQEMSPYGVQTMKRPGFNRSTGEFITTNQEEAELVHSLLKHAYAQGVNYAREKLTRNLAKLLSK